MASLARGMRAAVLRLQRGRRSRRRQRCSAGKGVRGSVRFCRRSVSFRVWLLRFDRGGGVIVCRLVQLLERRKCRCCCFRDAARRDHRVCARYQRLEIILDARPAVLGGRSAQLEVELKRLCRSRLHPLELRYGKSLGVELDALQRRRRDRAKAQAILGMSQYLVEVMRAELCASIRRQISICLKR